MIVCARKRVVPDMLQIVILEKNGYYFYLHREVYDQAVILSDTYKDTEHLIQKWGLVDHSDTAVVQWFSDEAPTPLNILAPFLAMSESGLPHEMEGCCAFLHGLSTSIHFRNYVEQPPEIRKQARIAVEAGTAVPLAWERFFLMSHPFGAVADSHAMATIHHDDDSAYVPADVEATSLLAGFSRIQEEEQANQDEGRASTLAERQELRKLLESK